MLCNALCINPALDPAFSFPVLNVLMSVLSTLCHLRCLTPLRSTLTIPLHDNDRTLPTRLLYRSYITVAT